MNNRTLPTIAGCDIIAKYIKNNRLFGDYYENLVSDGENDPVTGLRIKVSIFGEQPMVMPNPSVKPRQCVVNGSNILEHIKGLPLTWIKVERIDRWCCYHNVMALFGDKHWVTQDRSGAQFLYIFDEKFG